MSMACPQCNRTFDQHLECPTCGVHLVYLPRPGEDQDENQWQQTPWGRMLVGLLLAQGLAHGLKQLAMAGILVSQEADGSLFWTTAAGIWCAYGIQAFSLLISGLITGAGLARGPIYGSLVGVGNAFIGIFLPLVVRPLSEIEIYSQLFLHLACGGMGGFLGTLIWKPWPIVQMVNFTTSASAKVKAPAPSPSLLAGPISWPRILVGMAIVVIGVARAQFLYDWFLEAGRGTLVVSSHFQEKLVKWEISALVTLAGAGLAGACTCNGLKQGLFVGVGAGVILLGINLGNPKTSVETLFFMVASLIVLAIGGGWFGGQLFPPLPSKYRKRMATPMA